MLIRNRKYVRVPPNKDAIKIYIFCEGRRREYYYFNFFRGLDSKIDIQPIPPEDFQDHSPTGLFKLAKKYLNGLPEKLRKSDEVWFVVDHEWGDKVQILNNECRLEEWFTAISNPCFEVWLYYHFYEEIPQFEGIKVSKIWKTWVNDKITGGFDFKRGADKIHTAIKNSEKNYSETNGIPDLACTNVFKLGKVIFSFVGHRLQ